jgi:hypothetical protein
LEYLGDGKPVDPLDFSVYHYIEPFPMEPSNIALMS